jgi:hypothetical protein
LSLATEFVSFTVKLGKEERAQEWMQLLSARQADCVATLGREKMHFESIFRSTRNGRLCLAWFSVQSDCGAPVESSMHAIDQLHMAFWEECIDRTVEPEKFQHVVSFLPLEVAQVVAVREARLTPD